MVLNVASGRMLVGLPPRGISPPGNVSEDLITLKLKGHTGSKSLGMDI